jgi:hypothetical protein
MTLNVNFRLLSGLRFTLQLSPILTIGQIRGAIASNDIFPGTKVKILYNSRYLKDSDVVGDLGIKKNEFLLCHPPVKQACDHKQKNENEAEEPHEAVNEDDAESSLEEMGFTNEQALVALRLADGNAQNAAEMLYRFRLEQQSEIALPPGPLSNALGRRINDGNFRITNRLLVHVAEPSLTRNVPFQRTESTTVNSGRNERRAAVPAPPEQVHEHEPIEENEPETEQERRRNSLQVNNEYMDSQSSQDPRSVNIEYSSASGRVDLAIQSTLSIQRVPLNEENQESPEEEQEAEPRPEMRSQDVQADPIPQTQEQVPEPAQTQPAPEDNTISIVRVIRDDTSLLPAVLCTIETFDREFAQSIRENPEAFLTKCGLDPNLYNCEEIRFIPPEFRFLNADIRKNMKTVISKDKRNGLKNIVNVLKETGNNFDRPITQNPEGFIRSLGLEPSDYNLDEIRSCPTITVEEVIDQLTDPEKKELIRLTRIGFSVPAIMEEFVKCNHNPVQARQNLLSL